MLNKINHSYQGNSRPNMLAKSDNLVTFSPDLINNNLSLEEQHLQELAQTVVELKLSSVLETDNQNKQVKRLHQQVRWLTAGWLASVLVLGVTGAWLGYRLHSQQQQLAIQIPYIQNSKADTKEVDKLEVQLSGITEQISQNMMTTLRTNQKQIDTIKEQIAELDQANDAMASNFNQRQQAISVLSKALEELLKEDGTPKIEPLVEANKSDTASVDLAPSLRAE